MRQYPSALRAPIFSKSRSRSIRGRLRKGSRRRLRSDERPLFAQSVSQLSAPRDRKVAWLKMLLSSVSPEPRAQLSSLVPGLGVLSATPGTPAAAAISPAAVQTLAQHVEQHDAGIVDRMSALYAAHPTLEKTVGTAAMMIAMREIAERHGSNV